MQLQEKHLKALSKAEALLVHSDFCPYLELKELLPNSSRLARQRFRFLFTRYYGLNTGGLTDDFKAKFFKFLFAGKVITNGCPRFREILIKLSKFKRKQGDFAMPFSFVSKLVGIHCESSPIYDRHVLAFFEVKASAASVDKSERIDSYVAFLREVRASYQEWANDDKVMIILDRLRSRDERLKECHVVRLLDFLVWKVGNQKLLSK